MLGLSISDCFTSFFAWFLSTWPQPKDTIHSNFLWGNVGNDATCKAQGFMVEAFALTNMSYTVSLTLYYLLYVRYSWKEENFRKIEPFVHFIIIGFAIASATTMLVNDLFNTGMPMCYINSYPFWCDGGDCNRGGDTNKYEVGLFLAPVFVGFLTIVISMSTLVVHVKKQEKKLMRFSMVSDETENERKRLTKLVFKKALKYVGAYILVWLPSSVHLLSLQKFEKSGVIKPNVTFTIVSIMIILTPLQGLFNALIYSQSTLWTFCKISRKRMSGISEMPSNKDFQIARSSDLSGERNST